jgi:FAD/FMN-containing dehydrogenase
MVAVAMCFAGPIDRGERIARALVKAMPPAVNALGPIPYVGLQKMFDDSSPNGIHSYWKTEYLRDLEDGAIQALIEHTGKMRSPFDAIHVHQFGGVASRTNSTAFSHRKAPYILNIVGLWMDPAESEENIAWVRQLWQAVRPYATGDTYLNFLGGDEGDNRLKAAYEPETYRRLVELKKMYDPSNLFRLNQNIKPD